MIRFQPVAKDLYSSRKDAEDPRLGDLIILNPEVPPRHAWVIAGYPDDEGIALNGGRVGAREAPDAIRRWLYSMTPSLGSSHISGIYDHGNLKANGLSLSERHLAAREEAEGMLRSQTRWLALGGGHDYAYADGAAFLKTFADSHPLIVNFDAHLDVRPIKSGLNSGTPFRRLLEEFPNTEMMAIGIQSQCNSRQHLNWLFDHGGKVLFWDELLDHTVARTIRGFLAPALKEPRPVFLSIDLDAFSSAYAPGCSQSWPSGLAPADVFSAIAYISHHAQVKVAGLYEVSPPLDSDGRTARLAALLAHRLLFSPANGESHE